MNVMELLRLSCDRLEAPRFPACARDPLRDADPGQSLDPCPCIRLSGLLQDWIRAHGQPALALNIPSYYTN